MSDKFRILAADKLAEEGLAYIRSQADAELIDRPGIKEDELATIIGDHDALIVRSGVQVTAKVLENPGKLKVIARAGVGVDNIDLDAATAKGILVMNSAEASTITTAEHAFALLMALARNIGPAYRRMAEGGWDRGKFQGHQLAGKTLGVVGFGRIGQTVAERALAFGMNVIAYDPFYNQPTALDGRVKMFGEFLDMLPEADLLTFHVPLNDQTRGLLNTDAFARCKDGVMVINAARGGVVDEDAVLAAVQSGKCAGAALDVYTAEPLAADSPLRSEPRILLTPHLGASTVEAQTAVSVDAARGALTYLRGEGISGAVNAGGLRVDLDPIQARFVDLADRMAQLLSPMVTRGFACVSIELSGRSLASAAGTIERMALVALLKGHLDTPLNVVNVRHVAEQRGIKLRTSTTDEDKLEGETITLEIQGTDTEGTPPRRIVGRVYQDMRPRVIEINGYHMDMVPAGDMALILNEDRPGMIGLVGAKFGEANVNIADMAISRRNNTALMLLKLDAPPPATLIEAMRKQDGILKVAVVKLAGE